MRSDCYIILLVFFLPLYLVGQEPPALLKGRDDVVFSVANCLEISRQLYHAGLQRVDVDSILRKGTATDDWVLDHKDASEVLADGPAERLGTMGLMVGKRSLILMILAFGASMLWLNHRRIKRLIEQQDKLSSQVDELRVQLSAKLTEVAVVEPATKLNRPKIEAVLDTRLGESAWRIMQLVFANPAISNKEIAQKMNLSLDGVSSSLRRIYAAFGVKGRGNKKVLLTRKIEQIIDGAMHE